MKEIQTPANWHEFYKVAAQFRDLAPWRWFSDSDLFGVKNPETGQIGWCCVMGTLGEHKALAVYRGSDGFQSFWNLLETTEISPNNPEYMNIALGQNCLMVAFEDAAEVDPRQKKHLKELNMSFRGAGKWIVAQTFDPGFSPWIMAEKDLPFAIHCLQQAMAVAFRYEDNPELLDQEKLLIRTPTKQADGQLIWEDVLIAEEDLPEPAEIASVEPSPGFIKKVKAMPKLEGALVLASFLLMHGIQEKKTERPWFPMMLMGIEPGSGIILTQDMFPLSEMPHNLEKTLLELFEAFGGKPNQLGVHHVPLSNMLESICFELGIELVDLSGEEPYYSELMETFSTFGS